MQDYIWALGHKHTHNTFINCKISSFRIFTYKKVSGYFISKSVNNCSFKEGKKVQLQFQHADLEILSLTR